MASVQVRILKSGRNDSYGLPLIPGSVVTVDRDYAVSLVYAGFASWANPADSYDGETNLRKLNESYGLYRFSIPFWIPPGDSGSNGLSFSGTAGEFTLSAAVNTNFWNLLASGGYAYIPAGAGGLATGAWYWCKMTSDTAGQIFAETHPGTGNPVFVGSPTALPNLSAGRITQTTSDVTVSSFVLPGGAMGPNGRLSSSVFRFGDTSATQKTIKITLDGATIALNATTTSPCGESLFYTSNLGVATKQVNARSFGVGAYGASIPTNQYSAVDTSVEKTINVIMAIAANTASQMICGFSCDVTYGA